MTNTSDNWDTYWQGKETGTQKAPQDAARDVELRAFWRDALAPLDRDGALLDLACGSGVVLKTAKDLGFADLYGVDLSGSAIAALHQFMPDVQGHVASAAATGLPDARITTITSQFGFEYAGAETAAKECARLLAPGGHIIAVVHMVDGAIYRDAQNFVHHTKVIAQSRYIETSKDMFKALAAEDQAKLQTALNKLAHAREQVATLITPGQVTLASHLMSGAAQLWDRREHYVLEDVIGWLEGMEVQRMALEGRMQAMLDAALNETDIKTVETIWRSAGLEVEPAGALDLVNEKTAWVLRASRSA
ncbi:MAG: class I SAM-dependent methyltransferase [Pseudomonadota bacterium]